LMEHWQQASPNIWDRFYQKPLLLNKKNA